VRHLTRVPRPLLGLGFPVELGASASAGLTIQKDGLVSTLCGQLGLTLVPSMGNGVTASGSHRPVVDFDGAKVDPTDDACMRVAVKVMAHFGARVFNGARMQVYDRFSKVRPTWKPRHAFVSELILLIACATHRICTHQCWRQLQIS